MRDLADLKEQVGTWDQISKDIADTRELLEMAAEAGDDSIIAEVTAEAEALSKRYDKLEFQLALGGPYDRSGAILSIHAGAGGTEAQDWASMLMRMYLRWAERRGYEVEVTNQLEGEEAGIKTVTIEVTGPWGYGYLKADAGCIASYASARSTRPRGGTHRLHWSKCCRCSTKISRLTSAPKT